MKVVSIDESQVRADGFARRKWRFAPPRTHIHELLTPLSISEQLQGSAHVPSYELPQLFKLNQSSEADSQIAYHRRRKRRASS